MPDDGIESCYKHPERPTRIHCRRCGQPICSDCMVAAPVGFQCGKCVKAHTNRSRTNQGPFGGTISVNPQLTTIIIVGVNAAIFLLLFATGGGGSSWSAWLGLHTEGICQAANASWYPGVDAHTQCLLLDGSWVPGVANGAVWLPLTSLFTHAAIWHIGCNMLTLWFIGPSLEAILGRVRFLALYLLSGLTGSVVVMWLSEPQGITIGASGSLFGLIGALILLLRKMGRDFRPILGWLAINVIIGFTVVAVSWQGHLGGLLGGLAIGAALIYLPAANRQRNQWLIMGGYAVLLVVAAVLRVLSVN